MFKKKVKASARHISCVQQLCMTSKLHL